MNKMHLQKLNNQNYINITKMSFSKKIRNLDVFKKVPSDLSQATNLGGAISIITTVLIIYFTVRQLQSYINPQYSAQISLQKLVTRQQMNINLDIQFPSFPCEIISLDLEDVMISHHPNIGSIEKWRLDKQGNYLDKRSFQLLREQNPHKQLEMVRTAFKNGYGCRLIGSFTVKEVPGNFHVSCHAYFNHYMQIKAEGAINALNMSHKIHQLYFGKQTHLKAIKQKHPQAMLHLLQGKTVSQNPGRCIHYHLDIVPTWYHQSAITNYYTYQYTYKQNGYSVDDEPGVVHFNYGIGGLQVEILPQNQNLFVFMTHLCAVIGGTYAVARALHNLLSNFGSKFEYQLIQ